MGEKEKAAKLKKNNTGIARLSKSKFITNFVLLAIVSLILLYLINLVRNDGEVNTFDPYTILGIEAGTTANAIKKAYRKLSLKYHPDKNPGDKAAEDTFMKIAKAYEALTDETSKENYEKYGNPDGKQSLEVSIGLPRILLDNPKIVLVLYLIAMVIIIPTGVAIWYSNSKKFGEKNIMYETYQWFYQLVKEDQKLSGLPEILATSAEFRDLCKKAKLTPADNDALLKFYRTAKEKRLMIEPDPRFEKNHHILCGNLLLHAHLHRMTDQLTPNLRATLDEMLQKIPELIDAMVEISIGQKFLGTALKVIQFSQYLVQGLWYKNNQFNQLPHFKDNVIPCHTLIEYLNTSDEKKKDWLEKTLKLNEAQKQDVFNTCNLLPHVKVDIQLFVEEEEKDFYESEKNAPPIEEDNGPSGLDIYEQDLVTLRVTLTHDNWDEKQQVFPVHAPLFPKTIVESWYMILTEKTQAPTKPGGPIPNVPIHAIEKVQGSSKKIVKEIRFMAPQQAGEYQMDLHILSENYLGFDEKRILEFTVKPAAELPEYKPHPDDIALDNEPTLFEQVMAANMDEESSDDDDDDDDDEDEPKTENNKKSNDDDDDDEDSEED